MQRCEIGGQLSILILCRYGRAGDEAPPSRVRCFRFTARTMRIESIHAREVFDSRGKPTVEVEVGCPGGCVGRAIVPSGASTGKFEAVELRDGDRRRVDGMGVRTAVSHVNSEIVHALLGQDADDQQAVDALLCQLDGTSDKSRLGANALLGVSLATACAAAASKKISLVRHLGEIWQRVSWTAKRPARLPEGTEKLGKEFIMPLPMVNMISGGLHAGQNLAFQDFLIIPVGARSYRQALDWSIAIHRRLGQILTENGYEGVLVGDEGGFGPKLRTNEEAVQFILQAIEAADLQPGDDVGLGLDLASSHFYSDGLYKAHGDAAEGLSAEEMVHLLETWCDWYPILSIEDGMAEEDWDGWKMLTARLGDRVQLIGDDLLVTNATRIAKAVEYGVANSVLIKLNQAGTLWETMAATSVALDHGYRPVISARSGETEDATIADLAVATGAGQIKIGSVARSERLAKYNQLIRIEEELVQETRWLGGTIFRSLNRP
jgi:enolase